MRRKRKWFSLPFASSETHSKWVWRGAASIKKKIKCSACSPIPGHITPETWRRKDSAQLTASEVPCSLCLTDLGLWWGRALGGRVCWIRESGGRGRWRGQGQSPGTPFLLQGLITHIMPLVTVPSTDYPDEGRCPRASLLVTPPAADHALSQTLTRAPTSKPLYFRYCCRRYFRELESWLCWKTFLKRLRW